MKANNKKRSKFVILIVKNKLMLLTDKKLLDTFYKQNLLKYSYRLRLSVSCHITIKVSDSALMKKLMY